MTDLLLRHVPSGPPVSLADTLSPPGTILGRPLGAVGEGYAEPLDGDDFGGIVRFDGTYELTLAAGQYDNLAIPDGIRNVEITPVGGNVVITGILVAGRGNPGSPAINFKLRGTDGILTFANSSSSSDTNNRITGTSNISFSLTEDGDTIAIARIRFSSGRWQPVSRIIRPGGISPSLTNSPGLIIYGRRTFTATGAAADDIVIGSSGFPFSMVVFDVVLLISTAVGATTAQLRDQPGGLGSALSSAISTGSTGTARNNATSITPVVANTLFYLRRSNGNTAGTALIFCRALS